MHQLEILPRPPDARVDDNPWPTWPLILRTSSAHEEGGDRIYSVTTTSFVDDGTGAVRALAGHQVRGANDGGRTGVRARARERLRAAVRARPAGHGLRGRRAAGRGAASSVSSSTPAGNVACDGNWQTSREGVFVCGDMTRGQSLIVWAIAEGRSCAASVDRVDHG